MHPQQRTVREADRVRRHTRPEINERIDFESAWSVSLAASGGPAAIHERLFELDREWDIERYLEANAASFAFAGVLLGAFHSRRWLILPGVVSFFLFQHAVQGWCPPLTIFRHAGVRTRKEIDREKYALKAIRGDFRDLNGDVAPEKALDAATT
jgi:hypothetical protein